MYKRRDFTNLAIAFLAGCNPSKNETLQDSNAIHQSKDMTEEITVKFGENGSDFATRNPELVKVEKQPAGLNFYSILWTTEKRGNVLIDNGKSSLRISNVLSLLSSENIENKEISDSFQNIDIGAGISKGEFILHDKARLVFYGLLLEATSLGWQSIVYPSQPRIFGKDRLNYALNRDDSIGLDAKYIPTLDEWMRIENSTKWRLYANRIFMTMDFRRDPNLLDSQQPGAYYLTFNFKTDIERFKGASGPEHRENWKKLLPATLAAAAHRRFEAESALKAEGFDIDESYQDPIPPI